MNTMRLSLVSLILLILSSCGLVTLADRPMNDLYCDNFLVYDMCARDVDHDGVVDLVYFPDSLDVIMYRGGAELNVPAELGMHRCAILMDEQLVATTSRVFYVDEETTYLERQDIRGAMLIKYIAYLPGVTACNMRGDQAVAEGEASS